MKLLEVLIVSSARPPQLATVHFKKDGPQKHALEYRHDIGFVSIQRIQEDGTPRPEDVPPWLIPREAVLQMREDIAVAVAVKPAAKGKAVVSPDAA